VTAIDADVLRFAPWSSSMADMALDCPQAFHRKYVLKEKPVEEQAPETQVGTIVHRILEWSVGTKLSVDAAFKNAYETYELPYETAMQVESFRDAVKDFIKGIDTFKQKFGIIKLHTELKVALTPDFKLTQFFSKEGLIRGVIDLLIFTPHVKAAIFDHKTGSVKPIDKYDSQARIYSLFADALMPQVKTTRLAIHYVGSDPGPNGTRTVWAPEYPIETVRSVFRRDLIDYLTRAAKAALLDTPQPCWRCNYCGYRPTCPAKQN